MVRGHGSGAGLAVNPASLSPLVGKGALLKCVRPSSSQARHGIDFQRQ